MLRSAKVITELIKIKSKLVLSEQVVVNGRAAWLVKLLAWCNEHEISLGQSVAGQQFAVTRQGLARLEKSLAIHHHTSLAQLALDCRGERKQVRSSDEKIAREKPLQYRVLIACTDLSIRLSHQQCYGLLDTPSQIEHEMDIRQLDVDQYDYLVVIENRDSFNDWHKYQPFASQIKSPLVIYRGHEKHHSKGCEALKERWSGEKGQQGLVYFGDADIAGLGIAAASATPYQHLLLPEITQLTALLDNQLANPSFDHSRGAMREKLPLSWRPLFELITQQGALRQQKMFNVPLVLY